MTAVRTSRVHVDTGVMTAGRSPRLHVDTGVMTAVRTQSTPDNTETYRHIPCFNKTSDHRRIAMQTGDNVVQLQSRLAKSPRWIDTC